MKPALIVTDLQNAYYKEDTKDSMNAACECINSVLPSFRSKKLPVLWVQHIDREDKSEPGEKGFEIIDRLEPGENDYRIQKRYRNAFNKTNLEEILKKESIDTLIVTGYCAEQCVQATIVGALDKDFVPILLRNGIASGNERNMRFIESANEIISSRALRKILE